MKNRKIFVLYLLFFVSFNLFSQDLQPPVAAKKPKVIRLHGDEIVDNYFWLREKTNPEVLKYLNAENEYAEQMLAHTKPIQQKLYNEMLSRIKETDLSVPFKMGGYFYYNKTEKGKQYPVYFRKKGSLDAPEETLLDLNELAKGKKFMSIGSFEISDDGNLVAFSTDETGFRVYNLFVKDLRSGKLLPDRAEDVGSVFWATDNRTLFYITKDSAKRPYRLHRHVLGATASDLLYEEKDATFNLYGFRTRSKKYLISASSSSTSNEIRFLPANEPSGEWKTLVNRKEGREAGVGHHGEFFYILTNDTGPNFRLVKVPANATTEQNWKEVVAHRDDVMLEGADFFEGHYILSERKNGFPSFEVTDLKTGKSHSIKFPEPVYSAYLVENPEWNTSVIRYGYESFITPESVYEYNMNSRQQKLLKQTEVLGGYDPSQYVSERLYATAKDGTQIPISIVYKKGFKKDGNAPMLLHGYGSYGASYDVGFSSNSLSLLDRGFSEAIAHIRGGGEFGKRWHDQGRLLNKMNTFTDFITAAEYLIENKYTSSSKLAIEGGSAGGLLMGTVTNMRPDLFKVVINRVPYVDAIVTMLDETIPLVTGDFAEFGNPKIKEQYEVMKQYSPMDNLTAKEYPAILVKTSFDDSQVMYWEPSKYVAKMRTLKKDNNPLIFVINMSGGHGGSSGRYDRLKETALNYAFILDQIKN
jgi:oligopeptidase B